MVDEKKNVEETVVDKAAKRADLEAFWIGRYRYFKVDEGAKVFYPEYMYTPWYKDEDVVRSQCMTLDKNNQPVWEDNIPDAPPPPGAFSPVSNDESSHLKNPAAKMPPFDYRPPAYARDEHSGGPANFDGNFGGDNNPRDPRVEGETPEMYQTMVAEFRKEIEGLRDKVVQMQAEKEASTSKADEADTTPPKKNKTGRPPKAPEGLEALKKVIDGDT